eukprot:2852173-Pyramimonas_sp.AAC.1
MAAMPWKAAPYRGEAMCDSSSAPRAKPSSFASRWSRVFFLRALQTCPLRCYLGRSYSGWSVGPQISSLVRGADVIAVVHELLLHLLGVFVRR